MHSRLLLSLGLMLFFFGFAQATMGGPNDQASQNETADSNAKHNNPELSHLESQKKEIMKQRDQVNKQMSALSLKLPMINSYIGRLDTEISQLSQKLKGNRALAQQYENQISNLKADKSKLESQLKQLNDQITRAQSTTAS